LAQHFCTTMKRAMKPQQQNTDVEGQSHVYVQKPDGGIINVPTKDASLEGKSEEGSKQTAENTPTTHSKEVTDGESA
jgi:N-acetyl-beta-hexosaminidase